MALYSASSLSEGAASSSAARSFDLTWKIVQRAGLDVEKAETLVLAGWPWGPRVNMRTVKCGPVASSKESEAIGVEDMFQDVDLPSMGRLGPGSAVHLLSGRFLPGGVPWCKGSPFRKPLTEVSWQGSAFSALCSACLQRGSPRSVLAVKAYMST